MFYHRKNALVNIDLTIFVTDKQTNDDV